MTGSPFTARVVHPGLTALLKRAVPAHGREWLPEQRAWLIHGTRVDRLLTALAEAQVSVELVEPQEPGGHE
jgi:hypothetical protein